MVIWGGNPPSANTSGENTPPEMPDNNNGSSNENNNSSTNEPPEKPDGDTDKQAPEKPEGENNGSAPEMPNGNMNNASLSVKYYVIFGVAGFGFTVSAVYLLMSKFNKLSFKETFINGDKVVIFILSSLILTGIVTFASGYFTSNRSSSNNGGPNNIGDGSVTYSSANSISEDKTYNGDEFISTSSDENALLISGDVSVSATKITITKTGDSD